MKHEIDATDQSLGRLASRIAVLLRGKDSPTWEPYKVPSSEVVVRNVERIRFAGTKLKTKKYHRYSGYPGGLKTRGLKELWASKPKEVLRMSVYRMLPKNRQRDIIIRNLKFSRSSDDK